MRLYWWFYRTFQWSNLRYQFKRKTIWAFHRAKHGWATPDTWGFDHYLAEVIAGGLRELEKNHCGMPMSFVVTGWNDNGTPIERDDIDAASEEWAKTLAVMAEGFEAYARSGNECLSIEEDQIAWKKLRKSLRLFSKYYMNLWD